MGSPQRRNGVKRLQPRPCDGCDWLRYCKSTGAACHAFAAWTESGAWNGIERERPSSRIADVIALTESPKGKADNV